MKNLFSKEGNLKVTANREQSIINVTLDFWTNEDERFMEIFCKVRIVGFAAKVISVLNPIINPDSSNPTLLFAKRSDFFDLDSLKAFFSETIINRIESDAIRVALMTNAPENEMITLK